MSSMLLGPPIRMASPDLPASCEHQRFEWLLKVCCVLALLLVARLEFGIILVWAMLPEGVFNVKHRIFARGCRKFINIEMVNDNTGPVEAATITLLEDGTDQVMTMQWRLEGKNDIGAAFAALKDKDLVGLMDVLDNYTGTLPNMQVEPQL